MATNNHYYPISLLDHFKPKDDYNGFFGLMCGYSADEYLMEEALTRFAGITGSRSSEGIIRLTLLMNRNNPGLDQVPGLAALHPIASKDTAFRLMHAKVALLIFRHNESNDFLVRLIVCTGNWTRQTLNSLDLVSTLDLSLSQLRSSETIQVRADIAAAWNFLSWLTNFYDLSLVKQGKTGEVFHLYKDILDQKIKPPRGVLSRFIDNRRESLLNKITSRVTTGNGVSRNHLLIGSGFYQGGTKKDVPQVIKKLEDGLMKTGLLSRTPKKHLYVNPNACQCITTAATSLKKAGYIVTSSTDPNPNLCRSLHAKFIFSFNMQLTSPQVSSAWVYLGSGNMTEAGFLNSASRQGGNLEAGMVLFPGTLYWLDPRNKRHQVFIEDLLPVRKYADEISVNQLDPGEPMKDDIEYYAPPIQWFEWNDKEHTIIEGSEVTEKYKLIDEKASLLDRINNKQVWHWAGDIPTTVSIRWGSELQHSAKIPVIDELGYVSRTNRNLSISELLKKLSIYPTISEDDFEAEDTSEGGSTNVSETITKVKTGDYPIRTMMHLVETIASKQTLQKQNGWKQWCDRLEQYLFGLSADPNLEYFKLLEINPFSVLWRKPFRPAFAEDRSTDEGIYYEETLCRIESYLELIKLSKL